MKRPLLQDIHQNAWQLACILGTALGLPAMLVGGILAHAYGATTALIAVIVGNLLLWVIGLGILKMTKGRNNAIENIKEYLGRTSGIINSLILVAVFVFGFSIQIDSPTQVFAHFLSEKIPLSHGMELKTGTFLGFLCSIICLGGIRGIKWICILSFPLLLAYQLYSVANFGIIATFGKGSFSVAATVFVVLSWLPGAVNLSTFFRHSKSKVDSLFGLSIMTLIHIVFQSFTILISITEPLQIISSSSTSTYLIFTFVFLLLSFVCINLSNIYFASAGWESILPQQYYSPKKYAIIGLLGTLTYTFLQNASHMRFLTNAASDFIACLAAVLLVSFLIKIIVRHRPRKGKRIINNICLYVGFLVSIRSQIIKPLGPLQPLSDGIFAIFCLYLIIIFIEETIWAISTLKLKIKRSTL